MNKVSCILLAGGKGSRFKGSIPKQFYELQGRPVIEYSLDILLNVEHIEEVVIVCDPAHREDFSIPQNTDTRVSFALPGKERQDSVFNGLQACNSSSNYILVHDSARPFIEKRFVISAIETAFAHKACAVGMPLKFTVKSLKKKQMVDQTLNREKIWEVQTPQVLERDLMEEGYRLIHKDNLSITDDVSLAELLGREVKLELASYQNLKITTYEDILFARSILSHRLSVSL